MGLSMVDDLSGVKPAAGLLAALIVAFKAGRCRDVDACHFDIARYPRTGLATSYLNCCGMTTRQPLTADWSLR